MNTTHYLEPVILVDESNTPIGLTEKSTVHTKSTPLHRGFSIFLFNNKGEVLLQQRSIKKITWPGVWSNTCCGHPLPDEKVEQAAVRRLKYELGLDVDSKNIINIFPYYRYRAERQGVVENEFCPVMVVRHNAQPNINSDEVMNTKWIDWQIFSTQANTQTNFTPWCKEETKLLSKDQNFLNFYNTK